MLSNQLFYVVRKFGLISRRILMNKTSFALAALLVLGTSLSAVAGEAWFSHYDRNHDNRWTWNEFHNAHRDWCRHHHGAECWSDKELRARWEALDAEHHGWVTSEQVRSLHAW
jgi:hypothetical protein